MSRTAGKSRPKTITDVDPKPQLRCLVAMHLPDGEYLVKQGDPIPLEDALAFSQFGWEVIIDYTDQEALARWEMLNRPKPKWNKW